MSDDRPALIAVTQLGYQYRAAKPVFQNLNFELHRGERLALVGGNGAGKSTLLQLLVGLQQGARGEIRLFGQLCKQESDFRQARPRIGFLFQDSDDQLFCPTVLEDVAFGPLNLGFSQQQAITQATETLRQLGMEGFAERVTYRLSGGEKRMVALATVLAMKPEVLLLDEPTNGLDEQAQERLLGHLASLPQAMIIVSHDKEVIARLASRALVLKEGAMHPAVLHRHPHQHDHLHLHIEEDDHPEEGTHHHDE